MPRKPPVLKPSPALAATAAVVAPRAAEVPRRTAGGAALWTGQDVGGSVGYLDYVELEANVGYDFNSLATDFDSVFDSPYSGLAGLEPGSEGAGVPRYKPLSVGLTGGTLEQEDALPGLRVTVEHDLNENRAEEIAYEAAARVGPLEAPARQIFDFQEESAKC